MNRILIVDDEADAADALKRNLHGKEDFFVVGTSLNGVEAISDCIRLQPDTVLMDIHMPEMDGITASEKINRMMPNVKIAILTMFREEELVMNALKNHCVGYIFKGHKSDEIVSILKSIQMGFTVYESGVSNVVFERMNRSIPDKSKLEKLTDREIEMVRLVTAGKKDLEIAEAMFMDSGYVRNCLYYIREKLGLRNAKELAVFGARMGL